jgi:spore germination protein KB
VEKAKISANQLFVLILLFELGSALLIPLAVEAKQDAWIAILLGTGGGCLLYIVYFQLYRYYPNQLPTEYMEKIIGKMAGKILAFGYILYFTYIAARVLRDFGMMLLTFAYQETPLLIVNALLLLVIVYTVRKGIEVLARAGEILFIFMYFLAITGFILIIASGLIDLTHLKPLFEEGLKRIIKVTFTQSLYVPFGEMIVFSMILPYLDNQKSVKRIGLLAIGLSGINLAIVSIVNISVLGIDLNLRSQFPLLTTIQSIRVADFLERLDVFFMIALIIGGFFKISIFFYGAIMGLSSLFKVDSPSRLAFPIGFVILIFSITIASNIAEHIEEGLKLVPVILHVPFQIGIPCMLLVVAFFKNRKKA